MATTRSSKFLALFIILLIASFVLAVSAVPAHATLVAGQADGDGATITEPANGAKKEVDNKVNVKVKASYVRPEGATFLTESKFPNYIYIKVTKDGSRVGYTDEGISHSSTYANLGVAEERSFTPTVEGEYLIEACRDLTYVNGEHVELAYEDFVADDSITIIVQKKINNAEITGLDDMVYTGQPLTPTPVVTIDGKTLDPETDYDVSYASNTNVGTATITVTGKGFYKDKKTATFNITQADIGQATMNGVVNKTYTGSAITQTPSVIWNGRQLTAETDYDLSYDANTNAGTATITAIGKGNFTGTLSKTFTIGKASIREARNSHQHRRLRLKTAFSC